MKLLLILVIAAMFIIALGISYWTMPPVHT